MPPIFCVISMGRARGKTTLLEWLIEKLTNAGIKIATIKHSVERFDTEEKDTWRHLESGAAEVVYASPSELVTLRRMNASLTDAIEALHADPDLILVEGFKDSPYPKIICSNDSQEVIWATKSIQNIVAVTGEVDVYHVSDLGLKVADREEVYQLIKQAVVDHWVKLIPGFNCGKCLYGSCDGLEKAIRGGEATIRECYMRSHLISEVIVDGIDVPLGIWPQKLLRELLAAFIKSLKIDGIKLDEAKKITVKIDLKAVRE